MYSFHANKNPVVWKFLKKCFLSSLYAAVSTGGFCAGKPVKLYGKEAEKVTYSSSDKIFKYRINEKENVKIDGVALCTILPPSPKDHSETLLPFLGIRHESKVYYSLCMKCIKIQNKEISCFHNDTDRQATLTLTFDSIAYCIQQNYKLIKIHEVVGYFQQANIFTQFLNLQFKKKFENDKCPVYSSFQDVHKELYCQNFNKLMNIPNDSVFAVSHQNLQDNPLKRQQAKVFLAATLGLISSKHDFNSVSCKTSFQFLFHKWAHC